MAPAHAISVDVEEWTHAELLRSAAHSDRTHTGIFKSRVVPATETLLDLFEKHGVSATFFILGEVAREHPALIKRIARAGHEIASHGYSHTNLTRLTPESFDSELEKTEKAIQKAGGPKPGGFRAPTFSIGPKTAWALSVLQKRGYAYDSSIFPVHAGLYGVGNAPLYPYHPNLAHIHRPDPKTRLLEIPPAVFSLAGKRVPVAGGFYLRLFPYRFLEYGIRQIEKKNRPAVLYVHPWEFDPKTPVPQNLSAKDNFISFHGRKGAFRKLERLLARFEFGTVMDVCSRY